eukprot:TRINITY_DN19185_c0_g1_i1.p1 TRINITY_DN19185_c0_g1~~TRINITY_DN19185_c0_g1_i1.p1  ORF type:complete len:507 (+),score=82.36 TRINITY_DN19185_c0_g1_i1:127-1521(+)
MLHASFALKEPTVRVDLSGQDSPAGAAPRSRTASEWDEEGPPDFGVQPVLSGPARLLFGLPCASRPPQSAPQFPASASTPALPRISETAANGVYASEEDEDLASNGHSPGASTRHPGMASTWSGQGWTAANSGGSTGSTWHPRNTFRESGGFGGTARSWRSGTRPLGDTWRQRSTLPDGSSTRLDADDGRLFAQGCVPNWRKNAKFRTKACLEHELTWVYYHMRRHAEHPQRQAVGERMDMKDALPPMRISKESLFQFWRDLRPPFSINALRRCADAGDDGAGEGVLYELSYQCGIDYCTERMWSVTSEGGTFDNRIAGMATVRIPDDFPKQHMRVISWGHPRLTCDPQDEDIPKAVTVKPEVWMPICDELHVRAHDPRLAKVRDAARRCNARQARRRREVEVAPLEALLLSEHASLPRLAEVASRTASAPNLLAKDGGKAGASRKKRENRIYTPAAGFIKYSG